MRKLLKTICVLLSFVLFLLAIDLPTLKVNAAGTVDDFIGRCYQVTLGRDADSDGYAYWRDILVNRKQDGSVVAHGFLFSPEYIDKATSNEQYVKDLYMLFMGREPEQSGYDYWCEKMANGESREQIFAGFANSKEYFNLCFDYGITAGYYSADYGIQQVNGVNLFVERMYQTSLDRLGDQGGQNDWVQALLEGRISGIECARSFVQSPEFINKGLSDEDFLKSLYKAFMGREYDDGGLKYWLANIQNGYTRDEVFAGFANSPEFEGICNFYGIVRGDYTPTDIGTYDPNNPNNVSPDDIGLEHTHKFDQKNTDEKYLKSEATCTEATVYYYSCECGEKGTDTFTNGDVLGHKYDKKNTDKKYLKSAATCTEPAVYYYSCSKCGEKDTKNTFKSGKALGHDWDEGTVTKEATLTENGIKTYKCKREGCNETKTEVILCQLNSEPEVGDIITFGKYEQDGNLENGKEDIEWEVLDVEDDRILVISKYALDVKQYESDWKFFNSTWETCTLRNWLNNEFYNTAFNKSQKKQIPFVTIENNDNPGGAIGGNNTVDKIFCLSSEERQKYFGNLSIGYIAYYEYGYNQNLICTPTQYAIDKGASYIDITAYDYNTNHYTMSGNHEYDWGLENYGYSEDVIGRRGCNWWLRSPGYNNWNASSVNAYGEVRVSENYLNGIIYDMGTSVDAEYVAVRPAMYINLSSATNDNKPEFEVGQVINFGKYEQDENYMNGKEDIEWEILSVEDGRILVISKYSLERKQYNTENTDVTWETCSLRGWLNNEFYNTAFSDKEKKEIPSVTLVNKDNPDMYETEGGNDTTDKVFCLSLDEVKTYYGPFNRSASLGGYNQKLICTPSEKLSFGGHVFTADDYEEYKDYGYTSDMIGRRSADWWLRSPGSYSNNACYVNEDGYMDANRSIQVDQYIAVRPAMYIMIK